MPVNPLKNTGNLGGKKKPQDKDSTRLQELSLMINTEFGAIHYEIHLDTKLDYTINRIFQEMSLTELETLHQLQELKRTQILQSLAQAVLKIPYAGYLVSGNRSNFIDSEGDLLWYYTCTKKVSPLNVFEDKRCYKRIPIIYKNKVHFVDTLSQRTYFWDTVVPCGSESSHNIVQLNPDKNKHYLLTPYPTLMQPLKKFRQKALELLPAIQISIYNRSAYTLNPTFNNTYVPKNFKNYSQKWTKHNNNPMIKIYANLQKQQAFQTSTHKTTADILKI